MLTRVPISATARPPWPRSRRGQWLPAARREALRGSCSPTPLAACPAIVDVGDRLRGRRPHRRPRVRGPSAIRAKLRTSAMKEALSDALNMGANPRLIALGRPGRDRARAARTGIVGSQHSVRRAMIADLAISRYYFWYS